MADPLRLSPEEFTTLASVLGAELLLGFDDPFRGFLAEDIDERVEREIIPSLVEKGILIPESDGAYGLHPNSEADLLSAAFPATTLVCSHHRTGKARPDLVLFHMTHEGVVEQWEQGQEILLEGLELTGFGEYLADLLGYGSQAEPGKTPIVLALNSLSEATHLAQQDPKAAETFLLDLGVETKAAQNLVRTLSDTRSHGVLVAVQRDVNPWQVNGFATLEGANGLWSMEYREEGERQTVALKPLTGKEARGNLLHWLEAFSPYQSEPGIPNSNL